MIREQELRKRIAFDIKEGARLKKLRKSKGVQAKFVADAVGVKPGFLSDLEYGRRHWHPHHIKAYLKAIGV